MSTYLAVDFGGGSGRVMAGRIVDGNVELSEVYRFANRQVKLGRHLYWDFPMLFDEMLCGLRKAAAEYDDIVSIGIDSWGVDYGLVDKAGNLIENPRCYRDEANIGMPEQIFAQLDIVSHYAEAGIQVMPINTMFQLLVRKQENEELLQLADKLLFMADLFGYFLTGVGGNDYCLATSSELIDARKRAWNRPLISKLGLPERLFGRLFMPGETRGVILPEIASATGLPATVKVVCVGGHDTSCAVYAVPFEEGKETVSAYLSSGTWSLLGALLDEPVLTEQARLGGFTNEGNAKNKIRLLQNITGLWILQCLIKEWSDRGLRVDYEHLLSTAEKSEYSDVIDVDDPVFASPGRMDEKIKDWIASAGLAVPQSQADVVRCVLLSLAARYKKGVDELNRLLPAPIERLHIIGGGCRNSLLNKMTCDALGIPVIAGPVEATAIGNILIQAEADS